MASTRTLIWHGLKGVLVFCVWVPLQVGAGYAFAAGMPDGFGNTIWMAQIVGAIVAGGLFARGLPSVIDPDTLVPDTGSHGNPTAWRRWSRAKGMKYVYAGLVVTVIANVGGYLRDRTSGVPRWHRMTTQIEVERWLRAPPPGLESCLAKLYTHEQATCRVTVAVTVVGSSLEVRPHGASCRGSIAIEACLGQPAPSRIAFDHPRERASLAYAWGPTEIAVDAIALTGLAKVTPPAERE